jgi:hypothetical protein
MRTKELCIAGVHDLINHASYLLLGASRFLAESFSLSLLHRIFTVVAIGPWH